MKEVGQRIQKARENAGLRQDELARRVGLTPNYLSAVERGMKVPRLETFIRIINELGVSADEILQDVLDVEVRERASQLEERIKGLEETDRDKVLRVLETMIGDVKNS